MVLTIVQLIGLGITLVAVTVVGISAAGKVKNSADFTVGGHSAGAFMVAGTIAGTIIGGAATVGTAQLAFTLGLSAWWFTLGAGLALLALAVFYAQPLRATGLKTIPEFLTANYGTWAGPLTGLTTSLGIFFSIVANMLAATSLVIALFQLDQLLAAILVAGLIVVYVFFGGVWGTGRVGVLKTTIIYIGLVATAWITTDQMGGVAGFSAAFPAFPWFSLLARGPWVDLGSALSLLVGTISTQTYIQAIYSAKDVATARRGVLIAALITLPAGIPAVMAGMFMRVHHPDIAPIAALPLFLAYYLPPWLGGMAIGALLLASVGSSAGLALGVGTMLSQDVFAGLGRRLSDQGKLGFTRLLVLAITLAAAVFTFGNMQSLVLDWNFLSMGLRGAGVFLPLTVAVFWPGWIYRPAAIGSMVAGVGVSLAWKGLFPQGLDPLFAGLAASGVLLISGWLLAKGQRTAETRAAGRHG